MNHESPSTGAGSTLLDDLELCRLTEPLSGGNGNTTVRLARSIWSRVCEPGDAIAGSLIETLGVLPALDFLMSRASGHDLAQSLQSTDLESLPPSQLTNALERWRPRLDRAATMADLHSAATLDMRLLIPEDPDWPEALNDLGSHMPLALWVRGTPALLSQPSLAVVGARACTGYGSQITAELTGDACTAGFTIVSGAAYGVDAVAHRTALAVEASTVAVLAGGADRPYPASHDQLISRIADHGAVCSELVPGAAPTRWRFLQRNRLIAALSRAILITEAGIRSGTLNTAGHGAEIGRSLGAVPGPITSATSAGCHRLVREYGASLITNGAELLDLLGASSETLFGHNLLRSDSEDVSSRQPSVHVRILDALPLRGGQQLDKVAKHAGITQQEAREALTELELLGHVEQRVNTSGGTVLWTLTRSALSTPT